MKEYENFEALNEDYKKLKLKVEIFKKDLEKQNNDLDIAKKNKENIENSLKTADPKDKRKLQEDLTKAIIVIEKLELDIEATKTQIENVENEVKEIIDSIRGIPEIAEECKQAVNKNTDRKISKFQKQKKEQEAKKETLLELRNILQKHPQAQIFVNNIENKSLEISKKELEIKSIQEKIDKLDPKDPNYASDKAKLEGDKTRLEGECTKLKVDRQTHRDGLKKLINNPKYNEHIDNLTTRSALEKNIKNCERLIRRSENKINDYKIGNIKVNIENIEDILNAQPTQPTQPAPTKWETFKSDFKNIFSKKQPGDSSRLSKIGKTFKNLFTKQSALPAPTTVPTPTTHTSPFRDDIKVENAMQYEVVRDLFEADKKRVKDSVQKSSADREAAKKDEGSR